MNQADLRLVHQRLVIVELFLKYMVASALQIEYGPQQSIRFHTVCKEASMLRRDDLIREMRGRSGNLSTFVIVYLAIIGTMVSTAFLIM